ncbi:MAG: signal peptidase II [Candidatus Omnitrophota bacterium]|nr:MAG: signal peptidase II [Candidatus Omnitrophota bacterium]
MKKKIKYSTAIVWLVAAIVFFLDFVIKRYLVNNFCFQSFPVIKNILYITVVFNRGAAFGILKGNTALLIIISVVFILVFLVFMKKENKKNLFFIIACGLVLGGALSNLLDRVFLGFVIDYIDLRWWPVFNLSDSCISVGIALLFLEAVVSSKKKTIT